MATGQRNKTEEIELDSKKLQVGEKIYYVDMKENQHGVFMKLVEGLGPGRMSRIVVSVLMIQEFLEKLIEMNDFIENNPMECAVSQPKPEGEENEGDKNEGDNFPTIVHSCQLFALHRRIYFDLRKHPDGYLRLRISYVMKKRRVNVCVLMDAIPSLINIVKEYVEKYPADAAKNETGDIKTEGMTKSARPRTTSDKENNPNFVRHSGLVVSESPATMKQPIANKSYVLEVVTSDKSSFMRMTEFIQINKKATLHIPLEGIIAFKDAIVDFVSNIKPEDISKAQSMREVAEANALKIKKE